MRKAIVVTLACAPLSLCFQIFFAWDPVRTPTFIAGSDVTQPGMRICWDLSFGPDTFHFTLKCP